MIPRWVNWSIGVTSQSQKVLGCCTPFAWIFRDGSLSRVHVIALSPRIVRYCVQLGLEILRGVWQEHNVIHTYWWTAVERSNMKNQRRMSRGWTEDRAGESCIVQLMVFCLDQHPGAGLLFCFVLHWSGGIHWCCAWVGRTGAMWCRRYQWRKTSSRVPSHARQGWMLSGCRPWPRRCPVSGICCCEDLSAH